MFTKQDSHRRRISLNILSLVIAAGLLAALVGQAQANASPVVSIVSVSSGVSVTVSGSNFPAGQTFTVRMGPSSTMGVGGTVVGSYDSGTGGYFTATYAIPSALASAGTLAIRFESGYGVVCYNWFNNTGSTITTTPYPYNPGSPYPTTTNPYYYPYSIPGYYGVPTFDISSVAVGSSVTVLTHNFPVGQAFTVRMGDFGTLGIGGEIVGSTPNTGGTYSLTFTIPSWLAAKSKIAIRMDSPSGYYAYNWFYNTSGSSNPVPTGSPWLPGPWGHGYMAVPTISIAAVVRDSSVTLYGNNFPTGQTLNVRMGPYGSLGLGGIVVASQASGTSGSFSATYNIPGALMGSPKIAIRVETTDGYYYGYNWFYNNSTY